MCVIEDRDMMRDVCKWKCCTKGAACREIWNKTSTRRMRRFLKETHADRTCKQNMMVGCVGTDFTFGTPMTG